MLTSVPPAIKKVLISMAMCITVAVNFCFTAPFTEQDWLEWTNKCLSQNYDPSADAKLKKWELGLSPDYFIRLRKTYAKGKQEYYSFNLHNFNDLDYDGDTKTGTLKLKTVADDIIVQTRNDREGDVDSMTTVLSIPVKNMDPDRLDSLQQALNYFKSKGM